MLTGKTYGEAAAAASPSLRAKIEHSVELLRKAEKLALIYDPADGFHLAFSAGKDSQALYHIAEIAGVRFKGHMSLTSVDPPEVIRFAKQYYPEVELKRPHDSIFNVAVEKGILPTMKVRWCCNVYKENEGAGKVTLIGIRHSESTRRANRKEVEISDHKYSGTLEGLDEYRKARKGPGRPRKDAKPEAFSINTADKESQAGCIRGKESLLISPIIDWEEKDVWEFLGLMDVPHCPLYDEGWKRLGCIGCPMSSAKHKARENERWPHVRRNWIKAIIRIRQGGVSQGERTNHKSNLGIWTGEFLSHSGGAEPMFRIPVQWMRDERNFSSPERRGTRTSTGTLRNGLLPTSRLGGVLAIS